MLGMFSNCSKLVNIDISNFDTINVINMNSIFNKCFELEKITGLKKLNTKNVTNMEYMFDFCVKLKNIDLSSFDTSNVTDLSCMFTGCIELEEIKGLNKFITINV